MRTSRLILQPFGRGRSLNGMPMSSNLWYLKNCHLFERLAPDALRRLESRCRARTFPRKALIYMPVDEASGVLLLASGQAKICTFSADGKQTILVFIEPGELFGELALFDSGQREEYAEATETSRVILIPGEEMQRLMAEHPEVALGVTKLIGLRRRRIERRLKYLLFRSNRERLVHLLLELAEQYGTRTASGLSIGLNLSHQDLASIIGSTRETVTMTLGELQAEGCLQLGRRKVVLTDLERLASSVDVEPPRIAVPKSGSAVR